jgi:hypothetical protein
VFGAVNIQRKAAFTGESMQETIYATFTDASNAEKAAGALLDHGVEESDISVVQQHVESANEVIDVQGREESHTEDSAKSGLSTTTAGDAGIGAAKGAGWGLGVGVLAALTSLFVPGVGLVIGGSAVATAIGAAAATTGGGAMAGAVTGYLKDQGFEAAHGEPFEKIIEGGGAIVLVALPSGKVDEAMAWELIEKYMGRPLTATTRPAYLA